MGQGGTPLPGFQTQLEAETSILLQQFIEDNKKEGKQILGKDKAEKKAMIELDYH